MDELDISGKRYISTRRAGKDHGYHSDYIGQLIRGGKVTGTKVGRAWYVEEVSLLNYLGKEGSVPLAATAVVEEPVIEEPVVVQEVAEIEKEEIKQEPILEVAESVVQEKVVEEQVEEPPEETKLEEIKIEINEGEEHPVAIHTQSAPAPKGLIYLTDDEPLLPHVTPAVPITSRLIMPPEYKPRRRAAPLAFVVVIGLIFFALSAVASFYLVANVAVTGQNAANVSYSLGH